MVDGKGTRKPRVRRFTEAWLREQLGKARAAREEWGDTDKPGLRARFGKSGTITWVHYRQAGGKQELLLLGRYPDLGLGAARERLDAERTRARLGMLGLEEATDYADMTVEQLVAKFTGSLHAHRKHPKHAEKELDRYVLKRPHGFKHLKVRQVARPAWHAIIEEISASGHPVQASKTHRLLGQMFNFALQLGGIIDVSPFQGLRPRSLGAVDSAPRQRVLTPEELRELLGALAAPCAKDAKPGRLALLLLLLTGKRTGELLRARWERLDLEGALWTIPEADRKAAMHAAVGDEVVPLPPPAVAAFKVLQPLAGDSPWVFRSPHSSASGRLGDTALSRTVRELFKAKRVAMPRWTPHDLRRTARSHWSEKLGIPWDLCERLLGHALPKVARTYDALPHLERRREALERWAEYLEQLASGKPAKVVVMQAARA